MSLLSWLFGRKPGAPKRMQTPTLDPILTTPRAAPAPIASRPTPSPVTTAFILPAGPFRFVAMDVETANSYASSICQIGLAFVRQDGTLHVTSTLVDPEQPFSDFNVNLHGIGPAQVRGAPKFPAVFPQIADLLGQQIIIQHSPFDRGAIKGACRSYGLPEPGWRWADSVQIARRAWPELRGNGGHGLGNLKQALALEFEHHDAGEDAKAAALVVLRAEAHTGHSLEDLICSPRRVSAVGRAPKSAPPKINPADLVPALDKLTMLVAFLIEARPLSRAELEKIWKANSNRTFSRMLETGKTYGQASGAPAFLTYLEEDFRRHMRSIDNDLGAQVKIVEAACRSYFVTGEIPAPHYPWRIAIILRKAKQTEHERAFLAAWCRHFPEGNGVIYGKLIERARKCGLEV